MEYLLSTLMIKCFYFYLPQSSFLTGESCGFAASSPAILFTFNTNIPTISLGADLDKKKSLIKVIALRLWE